MYMYIYIHSRRLKTIENMNDRYYCFILGYTDRFVK